MHIHTNVLERSDLQDALNSTGLASRGVYLDTERGVSVHGSRSRARRIDFYLVADDGYGRRYANSGSYGAGHSKAATWDEWGVLLAELFRRDPDAIMAYYSGRRDFEAKTERTINDWHSLALPGAS